MIGARSFERCEPEGGWLTAWRCSEIRVTNGSLSMDRRPVDQVAPAVDFSTLGVGCRAGSLAEESG